MFFDIFKGLCDEKGVSCKRAAEDIGLSNSITTKWKKTGATPQGSTLQKIAEYFGVPVSVLLDGGIDNPIVYCNDCGLQYNSQDPEEVIRHTEKHNSWQKAVDKFGFCWPYSFREQKKATARNEIANGTLTDDEYVDAQINIFKALFSRSLESCGYDLQHAKFEDYVAMMLNQKIWKNELPPSVYTKISTRFGVKSGIQSGSYYQIKKASTQEGGRVVQNEDEEEMLLLARHMEPIPEEDRKELKAQFKKSIDMYLKAMGLSGTEDK